MPELYLSWVAAANMYLRIQGLQMDGDGRLVHQRNPPLLLHLQELHPRAGSHPQLSAKRIAHQDVPGLHPDLRLGSFRCLPLHLRVILGVRLNIVDLCHHLPPTTTAAAAAPDPGREAESGHKGSAEIGRWQGGGRGIRRGRRCPSQLSDVYETLHSAAGLRIVQTIVEYFRLRVAPSVAATIFRRCRLLSSGCRSGVRVRRHYRPQLHQERLIFVQVSEVTVYLGEGRGVHENVKDSLVAPKSSGRLWTGYTAKGVGLDTKTGVYFRHPGVGWEELRRPVFGIRWISLAVIGTCVPRTHSAVLALRGIRLDRRGREMVHRVRAGNGGRFGGRRGSSGRCPSFGSRGVHSYPLKWWVLEQTLGGVQQVAEWCCQCTA